MTQSLVQGSPMPRFRALVLLLALSSVGLSADHTDQLEPGMTKDDVHKLMGTPADKSFRGTDEAWQYQKVAGFGQCKYTTVWIREAKVVGVSSRRGSSVAGCGLGSHPIDWSEMPK
jgi:hypothetical protein